MGLRQLRILVHRLAAEDGEPSPPGASEEAIERFCHDHGMRLPLDLLTWLRLTNGPAIGPGRAFGVGTGSKWGDAAMALARHPTWITSGFFPLANDGCGNYFLVDTSCGCVGFVEPLTEPDGFAYVVGSSTLRFMEGMIGAALMGRAYPLPDREVMVLHDPSIERFRHIAPMLWDGPV